MPTTRRPQLPTRVVAPAAGVSVQTRLRLDPDEQALLAAVGAHLTRARNADLAAARRGEKANDGVVVDTDRAGVAGVDAEFGAQHLVAATAPGCAARSRRWRRGRARRRGRCAGAGLEDRADARLAVRIDIKPSTDTKGRLRTYLRIAWVRPALEVAELPAARAGGVVGVDLNADHLAIARVNSSGNPVGRPVRVPLNLAGASTSTRDGRLRAAITAVLEHAMATGATAVAVEDLDFTDSKTREKFGRRKTFRHLIAGFPTTQFKHRIVAMAHTRDRGRPALHQPLRRRVVAARSLNPHSSRDQARRCLGCDRSPLPRARPHHPSRPQDRTREAASAARSPPERWKHGTQPNCGPGTGNH